MDGPPPSFKPTYPPSWASGSVPPTRTQSSDSVQPAHDRTAAIEGHGDHSRLPGQSLIANSSPRRNEALIDPVSTAPAGARHVRFDLDVNQPNGAFHDQSSALSLLHPNDPTGADAEPRLDIPPDIRRPPSPFNKGSVTPAGTQLSLNIPFDDERPPGPFRGGFVTSATARLGLDIPLDNERPPNPFHGRLVPSATAELALHIPFDNERPPDPFNRRFVSAPTTLNIGEGENEKDRQAFYDHRQNDIPPSPFNHGSLRLGMHSGKTVTNTPSGLAHISCGRRSDLTLAFVSLTRPLFS